MSNKSTLDCGSGAKSETSFSQVDGVREDQAEIILDSENSAGRVANNSRKAGLSKREIMEELSRQRFPWDE
jgi:hypothetical protein